MGWQCIFRVGAYEGAHLRAKKFSRRTKLIFVISGIVLANLIGWWLVFNVEAGRYASKISGQNLHQPKYIVAEIEKTLGKSPDAPSNVSEVVKLLAPLNEFIDSYCKSEGILFVLVIWDGGLVRDCENPILPADISYHSDASLPIGTQTEVIWTFLPNNLLCFVTRYALMSRTVLGNNVVNSRRYIEVGFLAADLYARLSILALAGVTGTFFLPIVIILTISFRREGRQQNAEISLQTTTEKLAMTQDQNHVTSPNQFDKLEKKELNKTENPTKLAQPLTEQLDPKKVLELIGGRLVLYEQRHLVVIDSESIHLTPKEHDLLRVLADVPGRIYSDKDIIEKLWKNDDPDAPRTSKDVKQQIFLLRKKIKDNADLPRYIGTERSLGYKLLIRI